MDISQSISSLLFNHECVIIPGLGGFVSNYAPAKIHPVQHLFQPPSKTILFNPQLTNNDGLLANYIAENEKLSFSEALAVIDDFSKNARSDIKSGKRVELEKIGVLYAGVEGSLLFDQDEKTNYLKASYGLNSFISPMISRNFRKAPKKPEIKFTDRRERENTKKRNKSIAWALVLFPLFIVLGWVSMETQIWNGLLKSETSLVPVNSKKVSDDGITKNTIADIKDSEPVSAEAKPTLIKTEEASLIPNLTEAETSKEVATKPEIKAETMVETPPLPPPQNIQQKMYHLIGGSFGNIENAESLILSYKEIGYDKSCLIGQAANGYYRVSISAYLRKNDAITELKVVRESLNPQAWILRK